MPRVITVDSSAPPGPSPVAPVVQRAPWPRVSMTRTASPAAGSSTCSEGVPRPPPHPVKLTRAGPRARAAVPDDRPDDRHRAVLVDPRRPQVPGPDPVAAGAGELDVPHGRRPVDV